MMKQVIRICNYLESIARKFAKFIFTKKTRNEINIERYIYIYKYLKFIKLNKILQTSNYEIVNTQS